MSKIKLIVIGIFFYFHTYQANAAQVQMSLEVFPILESIGIGSDGKVVFDAEKWKQNKLASTPNVTSYDYNYKSPNTMKRIVLEKDKNNQNITKSVSYLGFYDKKKDGEIESSIYIGLEKNEFSSITTCNRDFMSNSKLPKCYTVTKDLCENVLKSSDSKNWDEVKNKLQSCSNLISLARGEKIPKNTIAGIKEAEEKAIKHLTYFQTSAGGIDVAMEQGQKLLKAVFLSSFDKEKPGQTLNTLYGLDQQNELIKKSFGISNIVNLCSSGVLNSSSLKLSNKTVSEAEKQSK